MSQMHSSEQLAFDLYDRLHKSLRLAGMNATSMGAALGLHRNTINNYLSGRTPLDQRTLIAWAFATGVPVAWLEKGEGEGGPPSPPPGRQAAGGQTDEVARLARRKQARHAGSGVTSRYPDAA